MLSCLLYGISFLPDPAERKNRICRVRTVFRHTNLLERWRFLMSGCMVLVYCIPGSGGTLVWQEWLMVGGWSLLGVVFFAVCKFKYKEKVRQPDRADLRRGRSVPDAGGRRCGTRRCHRCSNRPCPCQNGWLKLR